LIAQIKESETIRKLHPKFNRALTRREFKFGLYSSLDKNGYLNLRIRALSERNPPIIQIASRNAGEKLLYRLCEKYKLCLRYCFEYKHRHPCRQSLEGGCLGACENGEQAESYNKRATEVLDHYAYQWPDFVVWGKGREEGEKSFVLVNHNQIRGYGFQVENEDPENVMVSCSEHPDSRTILLRYLRGVSQENITVLPASAETL